MEKQYVDLMERLQEKTNLSPEEERELDLLEVCYNNWVKELEEEI
jgi:hypothetical protein